VPLTEHPKWTGSPDWFLNTEERGNPYTRLRPFTTGNDVRPLIEGATYYADLLAAVRRQRKGDLLLFTDWRGDPDERLDGAGTEIGRVFSEAAERGVLVKGLIWRSHWDRLAFSAEENRHLGDAIEAAGGECLRDMRVRSGGSHHQKFVVLRHPDRPELDVAYVGGIDLCHSRRDTSEHTGDPQPLNMSDRYGPRPPWHDVQVAIRGPAVGDVETTFRERWTDPTPLIVGFVSPGLRRDGTPWNAYKIMERVCRPFPMILAIDVQRFAPQSLSWMCVEQAVGARQREPGEWND